MVQGINDISIVVDRSNYEKLYKTLIDVDLQYPSTAILILHSPPEASGPGVIHYLTAPIAKAGIAIEMHTLKQDTIFLVDEKNSSEVFSILKKIIDRCR